MWTSCPKSRLPTVRTRSGSRTRSGASEGWGQLAFYSSVIADSEADGVTRRFAVLAPNPISDAENHVYIPWQHVAAAGDLRWESDELGPFKDMGKKPDG